MRLCVVAALLLGLLAVEHARAARLFKAGNAHLKRTVGKKAIKGVDGRLRYKEVDAEHFGRAAFDPTYGHEDEFDAGDLGYDIHDATPTVIEGRLRELFPKIDTNHDGMVSTDELQRHLYGNGQTISWRRGDSEFNDTDANHDGKISQSEYLLQLIHDENEAVKAAVAGGGMPSPLDYASFVDVTRAAMVYADRDGDGGLQPSEFYDFLNPEEGNNINLKLHRLRQDIYEHRQGGLPHSADMPEVVVDAHGHTQPSGRHGHPPAPKAAVSADDLTLSFELFYEHMWSQFTVWESHGGDNWDEAREKEGALRKFVLLDTNADHRLSAEELLPAFADLHPTENRYARMQAEHMMDMADCKDDRLTLDQMMAVPHAFYGAVPEHDEL